MCCTALKTLPAPPSQTHTSPFFSCTPFFLFTRHVCTSTGQLPILHVGDACFAQSAAQLRYAGRLAGLYPIGDDNTDHLAALAVDEVVETALEILNKAPNSEDQAKK